MWKLELLLILISAKCTKLQTSNEVCYEQYCYRWNGGYSYYINAEKCESPYFELEIYDADVMSDVTRFANTNKMAESYYVPLGIKCNQTKCWWKRLNAEVSYKIIKFVNNNRNGIVFSSLKYFDSWYMASTNYINNFMCAVICMKAITGNQIEGDKGQTTKDTQTYKDTQTMIIGIALGTASFALIILMVVLLVLVLKRKRHHDADEKKLKSNSKKSSNLKPIKSHDIIIIPSTSSSSSSPSYEEIAINPLSSSPYEKLAINPSSSSPYEKLVINPSSSSSPTYADVLTSDTYANSPAFQTGSRPSAILYDNLDWSKSKKEKKENISKVNNNKEVYENNVLMMMTKIGPMGDEYDAVN